MSLRFTMYKLRRLAFILLGITLVLTSTFLLNTFDFDTTATIRVSSSQYFNFWPSLADPYSLTSGPVYEVLKRNSTLGVASKIYVLSLPTRTDRRKDMEFLRKQLGLSWSYEHATSAESPIITDISESVRFHRQHNPLEFTWPETAQISSKSNLELFDDGFLIPVKTQHIETNQTAETEPLTCAIEDYTVIPYSPTFPAYLILTAPRIACWYSHLSVLTKVANDHTLTQDDAAIILEDDVDMERDIHQRLEYLWPFLPRDWDMVLLGHCWSNESAKPALNNPGIDEEPPFPATFLHPSNKPYCTHAYAVSRRGARKLVTYLRYTPFAFSRAIDQALSWLIREDRIKAYSVVPTIVVQRKSGNSDIMPGKGSSWKGRLVDGIFSD